MTNNQQTKTAASWAAELIRERDEYRLRLYGVLWTLVADEVISESKAWEMAGCSIREFRETNGSCVMSEWIEWEGGEQPVPYGTGVEVIFADGGKSWGAYPAEILRWAHLDSAGDITSYRIVDDESDPVNHPSHYAQQGGVECIEAMRSMLSAEEYRGYLRGQMLKYTWRAPHKGKYRQDMEKAQWYLARLLEQIERETET